MKPSCVPISNLPITGSTYFRRGIPEKLRLTRGGNDDSWLRFETEAGWREIFFGGMGATTAHFRDGASFTVQGDDVTSGWFARARMFGGTAGFAIGGEIGAEARRSNVNLTARGTVRIGF
ncbi:MAG: hypothetical protein ABIQ81_02315 [Novosphingobium sp.]